MTDEKKGEAGAPGIAGAPGNLPPTAADYGDLAARLADAEKALNIMAPRLTKLEKVVEEITKAAAAMLPPAARKGFLAEILG